jgi:hypothetical protein
MTEIKTTAAGPLPEMSLLWVNDKKLFNQLTNRSTTNHLIEKFRMLARLNSP